jgi:hypothetical protein
MSLISRIARIVFPPMEDEMLAQVRHENDIHMRNSAVRQWMRDNADLLPRPTKDDEDQHEWMDRYEDEALRLYVSKPLPGVSASWFYDSITLYAKNEMFFSLMK